jgi:hypothetical protein
MLRAELRCNDIEPVVSKWRLAQRGHFDVFHVVWSALSYVIDIFKDETVKAVTEEQKKAIFSVLSGRDTFVCLQTTVSLWITSCSRKNRFDITWWKSLVVMAILAHARQKTFQI